LQKAWRRNQLAFGAGIAVALALVFGIMAATWQAIRATRAEREQARLRSDAVAARSVAEQAQVREQKQREQAEATELLARRTAYASDMNLVQQALTANNLGRAQALLYRHRPPPASNASAPNAKSQPDLRDWEWRYLWSQTRPEEHEVLWRGTNRMRRLSYSVDGKLLAFESGARAIIMDVVSQKIVLQGQRSFKPVFANRARLLAYEDYGYGTNAAIVLWDTAQRREIRRLPDPGNLRHVVFSADDQRLLVVSPQLAQAGPATSGLLLSSWDVAAGMLVWQKPIASPQTGVGRTFAVSPDGTAVAAAVRGGRLQVLETRDGAERFSLKATEEAVTSLAFSPDGKTLASGAGFTDSTIKLWDALKGTALDSLEGHRAWVSDLAFAPDGSRLISASGDQTIRLWDWSTRQPASVLRGHLGEVEGLAVAPDGRTLASGCKDGTIYLWELDRPAAHPAYRTLTGKIRTGAFTADSKSILGIESRGGLALWDVPTLHESRRLRENSTTNSPFPIIAPDASRIAFVEPDGGLRLLDLQSGVETVRQLPGERVGGGLFTRNGNYFVNLTRGRTNDLAQVWDARTWVSTGSFPIRLNDLSVAVPRLPNSLLITRGDTLQLWDVSKPGEPPREMVNAGGFYDFETSPNGRIAAGAFESGHVQLWDLATLQPLETLKGFLLGAHSVTFSPDGKRLAAGSNGQEAVKFWDVETRQEVLTLKGEGSVFQTIAFSPDGNSLMAINAGGVCHIWTAPSFAEIEAEEKAQAK
jgi:WD40 repeat protein